MTLVRFLKADGSLDREVETEEGANLLDLAQANGQPLEAIRLLYRGSLAWMVSSARLPIAESDTETANLFKVVLLNLISCSRVGTGWADGPARSRFADERR